MIATSSALAERTVPSVVPELRPRPPAPGRTRRRSRWRPSGSSPGAIISVSSVPDAPTSMPATIRTLFSSSKPPAATARPVNAFSSEITTGMSAPPIGSTKRTPKSAAAAISTQSSHSAWTPATSARPAARPPRNTSAFPTFCPGYVIGRPPISSCSFAKAIIEPGERDRADQRREHDRERDVDRRRTGLGEDAVQLGERDQRRRAAADAVEQRHHLRHRGHLHLARRDGAEAAADQHRDRRSPTSSSCRR